MTTPALSGPWVAVLTDQYGWPIDLDGDDAGGETFAQIAVVRGSAAPETPGLTRRPRTYQASDVLYEVTDFDSDEELAQRWEQAQAVAEALNTTAEYTWRHNRFIGLAEVSTDRAEAEQNVATCRAANPGHDVAVVTRLVTEWRDVEPRPEANHA